MPDAHFFSQIRGGVIDHDTLRGLPGHTRDRHAAVAYRGRDPLCQVVRRNGHVDKAWAGNLDLAHDANQIQVVHHRLCEGAGI